jgi:hypothetical protein
MGEEKIMNQIVKNVREAEQKTWEAIRSQKNFTLRSLHEESGVELKNLPQIVGRMVVAQFLEVDRSTRPHKYKLIKDAGKYCPSLDVTGRVRPPSTQDKIWMAIKALKSFKASDVTLVTETSYPVAKQYLYYLNKAGYVKRVGRDAGQHLYRFQKTHDTGLRSPSVMADGVYDRNLKKYMWVKTPVSTQDNVGVQNG